MSQRQKILIVDDKKENLLALRKVLSDLDVEIIEAADGNEALAATLEHDFSVAILDIMMPSMDGYELAGYLKGDIKTRNTPIIFVTAVYSEEERVFKGYEAGAVDYIVKPYNPAILLSKVHVFLELEKARAQLSEKIDALTASERALRESEQRFRLALRNAPVSVAAQDRDLRYVWAYNQRTAKPEEIIGHLDNEIFTPEEAAHVTAIKRRVLDEGIELREQMWFKRPSGRIFLDVCWEPIRDEAGRVTGVASATVDLTPIKLAEDALKVSLAEKEVLLKEIHHRVKNNMQVISSLVSLQADELQDPAIRSVFQDVTHRVRSMALVHEKLYQSPDLARIDFAEYARSLLNYLWRAHGSEASGIRHSLDLEPVSLSVDTAVPCGLILNELATNALKHAFVSRDGGVVTVSLRRTVDGQVRLSVRDNGTGLQAGFDWKQNNTLGLRLVQMLAGQIQATVEVSSQGGTKFTLTFKRTET